MINLANIITEHLHCLCRSWVEQSEAQRRRETLGFALLSTNLRRAAR